MNYAVFSKPIPTQYCFGTSCVMGHIRKWWYSVYFKSLLGFRAEGEQEGKLHTGDQNLNGVSWKDRRLNLIICFLSCPVHSRHSTNTCDKDIDRL